MFQLFHNLDAIIIDAMPKESYHNAHVPGAVNAEMPTNSLTNATEEQKNRL